MAASDTSPDEQTPRHGANCFSAQERQQFDAITDLCCSVFAANGVAVYLDEGNGPWLLSRAGILPQRADRAPDRLSDHPTLHAGAPRLIEGAEALGLAAALALPAVRCIVTVPFYGTHAERLGTLCLLDPAQHPFPASGFESLAGFARLVEKQIVQQREAAETSARLRSAEQASADRARQLATMAHELRSPLNAVIGLAELIAATPHHAAKYISMIKDSGEHLLALVNDIMALAKIDSGAVALEISSVNLVDLSARIIRLYTLRARERGIALHFSTAEPALIFASDSKILRQILTNIVVNAITYTKDGGEVSLQLDCIGETIHIIISDTGVGIAPEQLARLGEPFYRADSAGMNHQGTGLGLTITRRLVELLGGQLRLVSAPGVGTAVLIAFPLGAVAAAA